MKRFVIAVLALIGLLLFGCVQQTPQPTPLPTPVEEPSAVPTPSPFQFASPTPSPVPSTEIVYSCSSDSECAWKSVNCCPETASAEWDCVNAGLTQLHCPKDVFCAQVIVPRPSSKCSCVNGECRPRSEYVPKTLVINFTARTGAFSVKQINATLGDTVVLKIRNVETSKDLYFRLKDFGREVMLRRGSTTTISFNANKTGVFQYCGEFCFEGSGMSGRLVVSEPQ